MTSVSGTPAASQPAKVEVWIIDLNSPGYSAAAAIKLLAEEERNRVDAFRHEAARRRYLFAHAALRRILSDRLQVVASAMAFRIGPHGKPELAGELAGRLHFNLTHSAELALVAISTGGEVGVDVERLRPLPDARRLAARFFTPAESAALNVLPGAEQPGAFFDLWTCKEALAKATGQGIMPSLTRFELSPGMEATLQAVDGDPAQAAHWSLSAFLPAPGYVAAVAVRQPWAQLTLHKFGAALVPPPTRKPQDATGMERRT